MKFWLFFILMSTLPYNLNSQYLGFLQNNGSIQNTILNPALPVEGNISINFINTFASIQNFGPSISDLTTKSTLGISKFDRNKLNSLSLSNYTLGFNAVLYTIQVGFNYKNTHFNVGHAIQSNAFLKYDKSLLDLIIFGNSSYANKTVLVNPYLESSSYHEVYFTTQLKLNDFTIGVKPKLLSGITNFNTISSDNSLFLDESFLNLILNTNFNFQSTGLLAFDPNHGFSTTTTSLNFGRNLGFAIDLGFHYKPDEKWSAFLSLNDLGKLTWTEKSNIFQSKTTTTFQGFELLDIDFNNFDAQLKDSILQTLNIHTSTASYKTRLNSLFTFGSRYELNDNTSLLAIWILPINHVNLQTINLNYIRHLNKSFDIGLSYTASKRDLKNIGFYIGINSSKLNINLSTQNILFLLKPQSFKQIGISTGLALKI